VNDCTENRHLFMCVNFDGIVFEKSSRDIIDWIIITLKGDRCRSKK
jgi:hypothetical protein